MRDDPRVLALLVVVVAVACTGTLVALSTVGQPALVWSEDDSRTLVVADEEGQTVIAAPVDLGDTVVLEYTHSVEKTPVRDVYTVREEGLVMTRMEFQSYGAGLPSTADVEKTEDGTFVYEPPAREPGSLYVSPGEIAGHVLVVDGDRYDLVERAEGETVVLAIDAS